MRPEGVPIQTLLLRVFLPAVAAVAIGLGLLAYDRLYDSILDGFDRKLIATSALTGTLIDARDHDRLIALARAKPDPASIERSPEYLRSVLPMRRIVRDLDITYLYTQVLGGSQDVIYVLDAAVGENHSPIGSEDDLPDETLAGIRRSTAEGTVHLSPIEFQEQWGLLKTAAAPVRDRHGRIVATAGADVNVSLIRTATQNALFASVVIGLVSLLACTLVTLVIVRRIAQPLDRLRREALRIAGGDHRPLEEFPAPRDIASLRQDLAAESAAMIGTLDDARRTASAHAREGGAAALQAEWERLSTDAPGLSFTGQASGEQDRLQHAAAARLARRMAADPGLAAKLAAGRPLLRLSPGQSAVVETGTGPVTIGASS